MELKDTVDGMLSKDYKKRFRAEYAQLCIRYVKLRKMIDSYNNLPFKPNVPLDILKEQSAEMLFYARTLKFRAKYYEHIRLPRIEGMDI